MQTNLWSVQVCPIQTLDTSKQAVGHRIGKSATATTTTTELQPSITFRMVELLPDPEFPANINNNNNNNK